MVRRNFTPEQIIKKLREAEVHISQGIPIAEASKKIGVTGQTYYRWRKEYGGLRIELAKKLKSLEEENARLFILRQKMQCFPGDIQSRLHKRLGKAGMGMDSGA